MKIVKRLAVSSLALACACLARAEDIDLFVGAPTTAADLPNVLFIIDNTANWNQAFANEKAALANTFRNMPENRFNVGIMLATETGSPNNNIKGGYVRAAFRPMNATNKQLYADLIASFDINADKGDGGYSALTMAEAYRYITGGTPYAGNLKAKTDYRGNVYGTAASRAIYQLPGNALDAIGDTSYTGVGESNCAKTFIIYISNGPNQQNNSTDTLANNMLESAGGDATQLVLSPSGSQSNPSDEWARFMLERGIVTYTIDVNPVTNGQGPGWTRLLRSMANDDDTRYTAVNSATGSGQEITNAVNDALSEIQAVNTVFASVSLPLSVNTQGTYLNQVYVGMFRPDEEAMPRWSGNLKQYKLGYVGDELRLQDADSRHAINSLTGFVTECARSHWSPTSPDTYWNFDPRGTCIPPGSNENLYRVSNFPDGNIVEKGAQGHVTRSRSSRTVMTCAAGIANCNEASELTTFATSNSAITAAALGAASTTERDRLIQWGRGIDVADENENGSTTDLRPSVHGDVVHSRPVAINIGSTATPEVLVFYGGNDGVFRAINGNRDTAIDGIPAGGELWSFMPPEFYPHIKRLHDNDVQISFPNIVHGSPLPKPYGIDGPIAANRLGSEVSIFASMRRGGRVLYAFEFDVGTPADIRLKWKQGCPANFSSNGVTNDTGCTTDYAGIGQTWSQPKVIRAGGYSTPLLIVGGGYDTCEDNDPNTCSSNPKGSQVLVLNSETGAVVAALDTDRSVVAEVAVVTDPATGIAQYAYAADLGGNVYRIGIGSATTSFSITKIASLGCATASPCPRNRKFMFAPDVVLENGTYILLLGSGDREKPRNYNDTVQNYFFMLRDRPSDPAWLASESGNCSASLLCLSSLVSIAGSANPSSDQLAAGKGWYLAMRATEQVVTSAITIFGTVTFSSHEPRQAQPGVCSSNLGIARVYNVSYVNAASQNGTLNRSEELPSQIGLPPSPVAGAVTLDDGEVVPFCIGCRPESPLEGEQPEVPAASAPSQPKNRVYWYIER